MLLNDTPRTEKVHSKATTAKNPVSAREATKATTTPDGPVVPFARLPHAILADQRLSPTDRLIAASLLLWACDRSTATMSNASIGRLLGLSLSVVERGMRALKRLGYVQADVSKPTPANITGRVVRLVWVENPAILPAAPDRRAIDAGGPAPAAGRARGSVASDVPLIEPGPSPQTVPTVAAEGAGASPQTASTHSPAVGKEDRFVEPKILENAQAGEQGERQRPGADVGTSAQVEADHPAEPMIRFGSKIVAEPQPIPIIAPTIDPSDGLTPGQRVALATMTPAERSAFEAKSPGMKAQILAAFRVAFEPVIFERLTRSQLSAPRFAATSPPDRSTAGLVHAVADGDPRFVVELAETLVRDLGGAGDRRRWGAFHKLAGQILNREVDPEAVLDALRQAKGGKAENPGAVFTHALKAFGWRA